MTRPFHEATENTPSPKASTKRPPFIDTEKSNHDVMNNHIEQEPSPDKNVASHSCTRTTPTNDPVQASPPRYDKEEQMEVLRLKIQARGLKGVDSVFCMHPLAYDDLFPSEESPNRESPIVAGAFLEVSNQDHVCVAQSEVLNIQKDVVWPALEIPMRNLCLHDDRDDVVFVSVWEAENHGAKFMGRVTTTVQQMMQHAKLSKKLSKKLAVASSSRWQHAFTLAVQGQRMGRILVVDAALKRVPKRSVLLPRYPKPSSRFHPLVDRPWHAQDPIPSILLFEKEARDVLDIFHSPTKPSSRMLPDLPISPEIHSPARIGILVKNRGFAEASPTLATHTEPEEPNPANVPSNHKFSGRQTTNVPFTSRTQGNLIDAVPQQLSMKLDKERHPEPPKMEHDDCSTLTPIDMTQPNESANNDKKATNSVFSFVWELFGGQRYAAIMDDADHVVELDSHEAEVLEIKGVVGYYKEDTPGEQVPPTKSRDLHIRPADSPAKRWKKIMERWSHRGIVVLALTGVVAAARMALRKR